MKKMSEAFYMLGAIYPFYVSIEEKNNIFYYQVTKYSLIFDSLADKYITSIKNTDKSIPIMTDLIRTDAKIYLYVECKVNDSFQISSAEIKDSTKILPIIDGSDGAESFDQTVCRKLIAIIGQNGVISQCVSYVLFAKLGVLNGSPVISLGREPSVCYGSTYNPII